MYTLREFRAKTKEAFDKALTGEVVIIKRGGSIFMLTQGAQREFVDVLVPVQVPRVNNFVRGNGNCKVHGLPLDKRGRCLQKDCKYA